MLERVAGIEPALSGRKHDILPLNYTRAYEYNYKVFFFFLQVLKYFYKLIIYVLL